MKLSSFLGVTSGKSLPAHAGNLRNAGSIPGLGRSPGEGNGNPIPRTEESGRLQSIGSHRVAQD